MTLARLAWCASLLWMFTLAGCPSDRVCFTGTRQMCECPLGATATQVCTVESVWGPCMCAERRPDVGVLDWPDVGTPPLRDAGFGVRDAGSLRDTPDSPDTPPECMRIDATTLAGTQFLSSEESAIVRRLDSAINAIVSTEVYFTHGAVRGPQVVTLAEESYATCAYCVLISTNCPTVDGPCEATYLATEGTVTFTDLTPTFMDATLLDVRLVEVTIDPDTRESTRVGSRSICIDNLPVRASTCGGDGICGFGETPENCPADCS